MTEAQKNIAWAVSRIEEEIAKAKAGAQRAAMRESDAAQQFRDALGVTQNHAADAMAYAMTKAVG